MLRRRQDVKNELERLEQDLAALRLQLLVPVPVVEVRVVRMAVHQRRMVVRMGVRRAAVPVRVVLMLVVHIVDMLVRVFHRVVDVRVQMPFGQVEPDAQGHERGGDPEGWSRLLPQ